VTPSALLRNWRFENRNEIHTGRERSEEKIKQLLAAARVY
jgi:hypothetical protein